MRLTGVIIGGERRERDGKVYCSLFLADDVQREGGFGLVPQRLACEEAVLGELRAGHVFPAKCEAEVDVVTTPKGSFMRVLSAKLNGS